MGKRREDILEKLVLHDLISLEDKVKSVVFESIQDWKNYYYYACKAIDLATVKEVISIYKPTKNVSLSFAGKKPLETECEFKISTNNYEHIDVNKDIKIEYVSTINDKDLKVSIEVDMTAVEIENISIEEFEYKVGERKGEPIYNFCKLVRVQGLKCQAYASTGNLKHYTWYAANKEQRDTIYKMLGINLDTEL